MAEQASEIRRLFFALWPSEDVQRAARDLARRAVRRGRVLPAANLHITLAFIGDVDEAQRARLQGIAEAIRGEAFELNLAVFGCWRRRGIAWLAPAQTPRALQHLHAELTAGLASAGFRTDRRAFMPHMTLARRASGRGFELDEGIEWHVDEFRLMCSELSPSGATYITEQAYPLADRGVGGPT